jgi:aryl-alcohol dehydrogenase-like predicted oxidoreductase
MGLAVVAIEVATCRLWFDSAHHSEPSRRAAGSLAPRSSFGGAAHCNRSAIIIELDRAMEFATIAGTTLRASRVGLGTWAIGGASWGGTDEGEAVRTICAALDRGINLIDTAPVYGFGRAEEIVGKALADSGRREQVIIATKVGLEWNARQQIFRNSSPARIRREVEDSLRRLRTDVIDLYQVHWPDPNTPMEKTAQTLSELQRQGTVRAIGVSNYTIDRMDAFRRAAPLHTVQPPYNLFERQIADDVLPYCRRHHLTTVTYGALCRGLLSGRMKPHTRFARDDIRRVDPKFQPRYAQYLKAVDRLENLAQERYDKHVIDLAVRWLLDQPDVGIALWGARRPDQLNAVDGAFGWTIDAQTTRAVDTILTEEIGAAIGPEFMAPP